MIASRPNLPICILVCLTIRGTICIDVRCGQEDNPGINDRIYLKIFKGNASDSASSQTTLKNPEAITKDIDTTKPSILYIHGFMENAEFDNVQIIISAYLERGDTNVVLVDWGELSIDINYAYVARLVPAVGKSVAESLKKLEKVIDPRDLHVIGHSLGAHVAGYVGRFINTTPPRITGLDPALPLFYPSKCHVRSTDAEIVVILHTDGGFYGTPTNTGSVDFYANKGFGPQPGCPVVIGSELCSHQRSVKIYAESIRNPRAFPAHKCLDGTSRNSQNVVYFGDSTPKNICGAYCFNTNSQSPYGFTEVS